MEPTEGISTPFKEVDVIQSNGNYTSVDCESHHLLDHDNSIKYGTKYEPSMDLYGNQQPLKYAKLVASWDNK